jgi:hypothetical protein
LAYEAYIGTIFGGRKHSSAVFLHVFLHFGDFFAGKCNKVLKTAVFRAILAQYFHRFYTDLTSQPNSMADFDNELKRDTEKPEQLTAENRTGGPY